jgi:tetratricopeptide (TPR) repeat protein
LAKTVEQNPKISALSEAAEQKLIDYASWHPHHSYILLTLAQAQQKRGNQELAFKYLEAGLIAEPDQPHLRWTLARIYRSLGQIDQAAQHFQLVRGYLGLYPHANLSEMLTFQGDEQASLVYLEQARKLKSGEPWGILDVADHAFRTGRNEIARVEYNNALQQRPKRTLGIWYPLTSKWEGNAWLGLSHITPAGRQQKMACLAAQSAYAYAMDTYHELIELSLAYNNIALAKTMLKNEQLDQSANYLQRSLAALRRKISIQNNAIKTRLWTADQLERVPNAAQHLTSIYLPLTKYYHPRTAFHPLPDVVELSAQARANAQTELDNNVVLLARLDTFEAQLAQTALTPDNETKAAALTALETTLAEILSDLTPYIYGWTPKDISDIYINQAQALRCFDRVEEADQVLLEASQRYPETAYVFLNRALLQAANDNPHEAKTSFRQAIECEPGNYWVHFDYAKFLTGQGNYELAQAEIAKAIAIAPGKAMGYNQLGHILYKAGKQDEAAQVYHQAMGLEPGWYAMFGGAITLVHELRLPLQIVNPTDSPYVYTYVWSGDQMQRYLLDDSSKQGKKYEIEWLIQPQKIWLQGEYQGQESIIAALSDQQPLVVAVSFQDGLDSHTVNIYERRYRFRLLDDNQLEIVLPPETWHNPRFPKETWRMIAIDEIMRER